eukprot:TRINITY_DN2270_c0_g1_i1.p1 TRINITY_DN2270_c0_g1~~TRINITY_DN2270_c0_g1_i1.p1  ORF type:complete len:1322 (-),score=365.87 TRINITY_DN2270_c0_g1_i1:67-4032(-)
MSSSSLVQEFEAAASKLVVALNPPNLSHELVRQEEAKKVLNSFGISSKKVEKIFQGLYRHEDHVLVSQIRDRYLILKLSKALKEKSFSITERERKEKKKRLKIPQNRLKELNLMKIEVVLKTQKIIRDYLLRKRSFPHFVRFVMKKYLTKNAIARTKIIKEIIDTERNYLALLEFFGNSFLDPVNDVFEQYPLIQDMVIAINKFIILSRNLLSDLENGLQNWPGTDSFGEIFLKLIPLMKLYSNYIVNYPEYYTIFKKLKVSHPVFRDLLKSNQNKWRYEFEDYLIAPVQRLPRYELLLKALTDKTPEQHSDHHKLVMALAQVKDVNVYINQKNKENETKKLEKEIDDLLEDQKKKEKRKISTRAMSIRNVALMKISNSPSDSTLPLLGKLKVTILKSRNLSFSGDNVDCYCLISLDDKDFKTKTRKAMQFMEWNETFVFVVRDFSASLSVTLVTSNGFLFAENRGQATFSLSQFVNKSDALRSSHSSTAVNINGYAKVNDTSNDNEINSLQSSTVTRTNSKGTSNNKTITTGQDVFPHAELISQTVEGEGTAIAKNHLPLSRVNTSIVQSSTEASNAKHGRKSTDPSSRKDGARDKDKDKDKDKEKDYKKSTTVQRIRKMTGTSESPSNTNQSSGSGNSPSSNTDSNPSHNQSNLRQKLKINLATVQRGEPDDMKNSQSERRDREKDKNITSERSHSADPGVKMVIRKLNSQEKEKEKEREREREKKERERLRKEKEKEKRKKEREREDKVQENTGLPSSSSTPSLLSLPSRSVPTNSVTIPASVSYTQQSSLPSPSLHVVSDELHNTKATSGHEADIQRQSSSNHHHNTKGQNIIVQPYLLGQSAVNGHSHASHSPAAKIGHLHTTANNALTRANTQKPTTSNAGASVNANAMTKTNTNPKWQITTSLRTSDQGKATEDQINNNNNNNNNKANHHQTKETTLRNRSPSQPSAKEKETQSSGSPVRDKGNVIAQPTSKELRSSSLQPTIKGGSYIERSHMTHHSRHRDQQQQEQQQQQQAEADDLDTISTGVGTVRSIVIAANRKAIAAVAKGDLPASMLTPRSFNLHQHSSSSSSSSTSSTSSSSLSPPVAALHPASHQLSRGASATTPRNYTTSPPGSRIVSSQQANKNHLPSSPLVSNQRVDLTSASSTITTRSASPNISTSAPSAGGHQVADNSQLQSPLALSSTTVVTTPDASDSRSPVFCPPSSPSSPPSQSTPSIPSSTSMPQFPSLSSTSQSSLSGMSVASSPILPKFNATDTISLTKPPVESVLISGWFDLKSITDGPNIKVIKQLGRKEEQNSSSIFGEVDVSIVFLPIS